MSLSELISLREILRREYRSFPKMRFLSEAVSVDLLNSILRSLGVHAKVLVFPNLKNLFEIVDTFSISPSTFHRDDRGAPTPNVP